MHVLETLKNKLGLKATRLKAFIVFLAEIGIIILLLWLLNLPFHKEVNSTLKLSAQDQQSVLILLNKIDARINQLSLQLDRAEPARPNPQIAAIDAHLNNIEQYLNRINPQNNLQQLQTSLIRSNDEVMKKVITMQLQIQHLKQKITPQRYMAASALPFQVTSIDIWNGTPQATIQLGNETALMAQGDTRSGWTLIAISFSPGYVVFKNAHDQLIKAELH